MAGWRASTNQSETKAAPMPEAASTPSATASGQAFWAATMPASVPTAGPLRPIENGMLAANTTSKTIETTTEISVSWPRSGPPGAEAMVGIASAATASSSSVDIVRV